MSLHPHPLPPIPEDTARVAHAAFPDGHRTLRLRDELDGVYTDADFATLYPTRGQPAYAPWRLALILVLQFVEGLSDRQAVEAVSARLDWKYALSLDLTASGPDASVLTEFRTRLLAHDAAPLLLDRMLDRLREAGLLGGRSRQRTDATHVLANVRTLNRLTLVGETLRAALNAVAVVAPDWLRAQLSPAWVARYGGTRFDDYHLPPGEAARTALAEQVGADGLALLAASFGPAAPPYVRPIPAVETLRQVWVQQYWVDAGVVRWRPEGEGPPARQRISSPYDPEARWGVKRQTHWLGYKVHLTETCAPNAPHLITQVTTTTAPVPDGAVLEPLHADLAARDLLPQEHLVDSGYVSAAVLVRSQVAYGVQVVGPVLADTSWQARTAGGIELGQFTVDWEHEQATCPAGHTSTTWTPSHDRHGHATVAIQFGRRDCGECGLRAACTRSAQQGRRLVVRSEAEQLALERARLEQRTVEFATRYAARAGIEGTLSEAVAVCGLRRSRYRGLAKTQLQQVLTAAALNVRRLAAWWEAHPTATTRRAPFVRLLHLAA